MLPNEVRVYKQILSNVFTHIHTHTHTHTQRYTHTHTHTLANAHIRAHTHTHTQTYTYNGTIAPLHTDASYGGATISRLLKIIGLF